MAREVRLALIWHMHQPDYRDPTTGSHLVPWTRLHSARGYTDVAGITERFPWFKQTINFSPVLLDQIIDLAGHPFRDHFHELALKPVDDLSDSETDYLLRHCFFINWDIHVRPHQRYNQLLLKRGPDIAGLGLQYVRARFMRIDIRDLVVLFCLGWCGFTLRDDPDIIQLIKREQGYSEEEKLFVLEKLQKALENVIPKHSRMMSTGNLELTCTPHYHPILPLLIDSHVRDDRHPETPLFRYPEDARRQIMMGLETFEGIFGRRPDGMWPSEGSVSQAAVELIQDAGIKWIAADEALLYHRSTGTEVPDGADNRIPWLIGDPDGPPLACCFRNRGLSDDIGFQFSWKKPEDAVKEFVGNLENMAKNSIPEGPPSLVTLVCDGENPWEHFPDGGEGFLSGLARKLENHPLIKLTTPQEYLGEFPPEKRVKKLGAGSWIGGNFDIWMGCEEDRLAWKILADAREKLNEVFPLPEDSEDEIGTEKRREVLEHIWVAEGSDWFWWYGEPYHSPLDYLFDIIFRRRLTRAYELMGQDIPIELITPVDPKLPVDNVNVEEPLDVISPVIDGKITTFYEWSGAGHLKADSLEGLLGRTKSGPVEHLYFAADVENLYIRLDINREELEQDDVLHIRILRPEEVSLAMDLNPESDTKVRLYRPNTDKHHYHIETHASAAIGEIAELSIPVKSISASSRSTVSLACFVMRGREQIDRCPLFGTISVVIPDEKYLASLWRE